MKIYIRILAVLLCAAAGADSVQAQDLSTNRPFIWRQPCEPLWPFDESQTAAANWVANADCYSSLWIDERSLVSSSLFSPVPTSPLELATSLADGPEVTAFPAGFLWRGQSPDGVDSQDHPNGGGTGLADYHPSVVHKNNTQAHPHTGGVDPTDPTAILTQIQLQNRFGVESYDASGYANTFVFQPVLPYPVAMPGLKEIMPFHIVRPTLPFPAPTADPDGPLGVQGGMGDLTILDVGIHPTSFGNIAFGYSLIAPTSTDSQLGLGEWQFGPTVGFVYKKVPKTLLGAVAQMPFSLESSHKEIDLQIIAVRHLPHQTYIRWGDTFWTFNTDTGAYNIPIEIAFGKVFKKGLFGLPNNVFVMPYYTPDGLHSGPGGDKWGVKLNVTLLFPEKKLKPLLGFLWGDDSCCH